MSDLNLCQFIGRLGRDPETRYMSNGDAVCNFSIASSETWKDKNSGQKQERTEWVRCTVFGKLAEIAGQYLKKGKQCYVAGKMVTRKWTDKDGAVKFSTEIKVDQLQLLGSGEDKPQQEAAAPASGGGFDEIDNDCPF